MAPGPRADKHGIKVFISRSKSDAYFACFCCKKRMLTLRASGEFQELARLCKLVRHERTVRRHTTARHIFDGLRSMRHPGIGSDSVTQARWDRLNHRAYNQARSEARAIGFSGLRKEEFLWREGFVSLYPEYKTAQHLLNPFSYDDTIPDEILRDIEGIATHSQDLGLKEPAPESLPILGGHMDMKPPRLVPGIELKICSTEISTFDERHPGYPRDSVEPRSDGEARHTNERKEADVMRFSNERVLNGQARCTDELVEKSWARAPGTDIAMDSRANSVEIKREPVEYNDELMTLG